MTLNKWRVVRYTDDGCSLYQCLACKADWEGRTGPGYTYEGVYHPIWHYCPVCGVKWEGPQRESEDDFGPRRQRIREAVYRRQHTFYLGKPEPGFWWVIEERFIWGDDVHEWKAERKFRGGIVPAARVLEWKRRISQERLTEEPPNSPIRYEHRIVRYKPGDNRLGNAWELS